MRREVRPKFIGVKRLRHIQGCTDLFAKPFVGHGVHGGFNDEWMRCKGSFDTAAADVLATTNDEVFDAVNDVQMPVVVDEGNVTGAEPTVFGERCRRRLGLVSVLTEHRRSTHLQLATFPGRHLVARIVNDT